MGQVQLLGEALGLGAFAGTGRAHHHDDATLSPCASGGICGSLGCHLMKPS
jgi:hypothetical protein